MSVDLRYLDYSFFVRYNEDSAQSTWCKGTDQFVNLLCDLHGTGRHTCRLFMTIYLCKWSQKALMYVNLLWVMKMTENILNVEQELAGGEHTVGVQLETACIYCMGCCSGQALICICPCSHKSLAVSLPASFADWYTWPASICQYLPPGLWLRPGCRTLNTALWPFRYQFIQFGNRGACLWTTCLTLLSEIRMTKSNLLPLSHESGATSPHCFSCKLIILSKLFYEISTHSCISLDFWSFILLTTTTWAVCHWTLIYNFLDFSIY